MATDQINLEFLRQLKRKGERSVLDFCVDMKLIASGFECQTCKSPMTLFKENEKNYFFWSCPEHRETNDHFHNRSVLCDSWFKSSKSAVIDKLMCIYLWVTETLFFTISEELQISVFTICRWIKKFRDVCVEIIVQENVILGGPGVIVEIYEAKFDGKKYSPRITADWVYLVAERDTNKCFVQAKKYLDNTVLLNILYQRVLPGTIIVSYGWNAYDCYHLYQHKIKLERNNNLTFLEDEPRPDTGENFWSLVQNYLNSCKTEYKFDSAVAEFMWRHFHQGDYQVLLRSFLMNISCDRYQEH